jgi:hypothetical protein
VQKLASSGHLHQASYLPFPSDYFCGYNGK